MNVINKGDMLKGNYYLLGRENPKCTKNLNTEKFVELFNESIYNQFFNYASQDIIDFTESIDIMEKMSKKLSEKSFSNIQDYNLFICSGKSISDLFSYNFNGVTISIIAMEYIIINGHKLKCHLLNNDNKSIYAINMDFISNEIISYKKIR